MSDQRSVAEQITRASKSNLAFGFIALPRERRRDISAFYAFCRTVDDIADDPTRELGERRALLEVWKESLTRPVVNEHALAAAVRGLIEKYALPPEYLREIIAGVEMDLSGAHYETWEDLQIYCHRVASVVGLVSIEIFGYRDVACRQYAVDLGLALQLTNIIRDIGEDYANGGRIYLPRADMARFGYRVEDLAAGKRTPEFLKLMNFQAERALGFYRTAEALRPRCDRRTMVAAEIMRAIYQRLLVRMQREEFDVYAKRYRLSGIAKARCVARVLLRSWLP